jgi:ATP-dependent Clp protease ATP-binding subunit ClpC
VVLLDEIEKAHPDVFNMLLQVLEDGRLTDNKGRTVSFKNAVMIMTSNVGAELIPGSREMRDRYDEVHTLLMQELQRVFRPEFLNRVDEVIVFHALEDEELVQIADLLLDRVRQMTAAQDIALEISEAATRRVAHEGFDSNFGARPLRRVIQKLLETPISKEIISGKLGSGDIVRVDLDPDGGLRVVGQATEQVGEANQTAPNLANHPLQEEEVAEEEGLEEHSDSWASANEENSGATEAAKQRAEELGVDLSEVEGSGGGGLITVKDVVKAAQG